MALRPGGQAGRPRRHRQSVLHALYRMFDERGELLYAGLSTDPPRRIFGHKGDEWWVLVHSITIEWYPDLPSLEEAEKFAILNENPKYNTKGLPRAHGKQPKWRDVGALLP